MVITSSSPIAGDDRRASNPVVTLVVLGFNQERFVRDAIRGAFAQTYRPLEIILSDDRSSDDTFAIMQQMAAEYDGPHRVVARQTQTNAGTLQHVLEIAGEAAGELLVLSAGDDISRPERVEKLHRSWRDNASWAVFSDAAQIDESGRIVAEHTVNEFINAPGYRLRAYMIGEVKDHSIVHGATSAYDMRVFEHVTLPDDGYILSEDGALSLLLHILGKDVSYVREPLVEYRAHEGSLTNAPDRRMTIAELDRAEDGIARLARSQANRCEFFLLSHARHVPVQAPPRLKLDLIERDRRMHRAIATWWTMGLPAKIGAIAVNPRRLAGWALPRLLPRRFFVAGKERFKDLRIGR